MATHTRFSDDHFHKAKEQDVTVDAEQGPPKKRQKTLNGHVNGSKDSVDRARAAQLLAERQKLPIWQGRKAIVQAVNENDTVIILGETGCGKTTQVPQFLYEDGSDPSIAITQPRRVAATSLAARVAEEHGSRLGWKVGYTVRFDDTSSYHTRIKYVTDGTLLQEMLSDRLLQKYDIVIVDEAHERTLRTDMILGFLKRIQKERAAPGAKTKPDKPLTRLKVVVMSATLDAERFSAFFDKAPILYVKGRQFKINLQYTDVEQEDYIESALKTIFQYNRGPPGGILVFLTGEEDIETLANDIVKYSASLPPPGPGVIKPVVHKLYAKLPAHVQAQAFKPDAPGTRKVVLATNIAETSITIPGIKLVIDCGLMKEKTYRPAVSVDALLLTGISQSSAQQRMGRAGREAKGHCYRLYTEKSYKEMKKTAEPEIMRCNLEFALLHLKAAGQDDVFAFDFMDRPDDDAMQYAMLQLMALGALNEAGALTEDGKAMATLPLTPTASRILLSSFKLGCPLEVTSLLALLESADKLLSVPASARDSAKEARAPYAHRDGDHLTLLRLLAAFEQVKHDQGDKAAQQWLKDVHIASRTMTNILDARKQLRERCAALNLDWQVSAGDEDSIAEKVLRSCASGLGMNTALLQEDGRYRSTTSSTYLKIHPSSVLTDVSKRPNVIIFSELTLTKAIYARTVSSIRPEWLKEHTPGLFAR